MRAPYYKSLVWQIPVGAAQMLGSWGHPLVEIFNLFTRGLESNLEKLKAQEEGVMDECLEEFILCSVPPTISKRQKRFFIY